eukprot:g53585.t1
MSTSHVVMKKQELDIGRCCPLSVACNLSLDAWGSLSVQLHKTNLDCVKMKRVYLGLSWAPWQPFFHMNGSATAVLMLALAGQGTVGDY